MFLRTHRNTIIGLVAGLFFSAAVVYATPPGSPYQAGDTLDPTCAPGDINCSVLIFPDQTGHAGEFLGTDGTAVSWQPSPSGSVSGFSFNNANGFVGTVTNATTTPQLTLKTSLSYTSIPFIGISGQLSQNAGKFAYNDSIGNLGLGSAAVSNARAYILGADVVGSTSSFSDVLVANGGSTFNTTVQAINSYGIQVLNSSTRSTGSNALTNIGLRAGASGATNNYAAIFDQGFVGVGTTIPTQALDIVGNLQFSGALMPNSTAGTSGQILISGGPGVAPTWEAFSGWSLTGNAGTTTGTNFIGTTDDTNLEFKVNSNSVGKLTNASVSFGYLALLNEVSYSQNNTAFGDQALFLNDMGGYNIGIGSYAGRYNTTASNQIFINSIDRLNYGGDQAASPIYIQEDVSVASQKIMLNGNVGISQAAPSFKLHVGSSAIADGTTLLRLEDVNSVCDFNANTGAPTCGSDITLKKDISSLNTGDLLTKISNLNPVSYHWLTEDSAAPLQNGFIAQEVAVQFPDLVSDHTWIDGSTRKFLNIQGLMPYVVGAVKELNFKVQALPTFTDQSLATKVADFLRGVANGIAHIHRVETDQLCIGATCVTEDQLKTLLQNQSSGTSTPPADQQPADSGDAPADQTPPPAPSDTAPESQI